MVVLGYLCTFCGLFVCLFVCLFVFMPLVRYFSSAKEATDLIFFFFFFFFFFCFVFVEYSKMDYNYRVT